MLSEDYTDTIIEHYMCPRMWEHERHRWREGIIRDPACGESLTIYIKVKIDVIKDNKFLVFGCAGAIATRQYDNGACKMKSVGRNTKTDARGYY